MREDQLALPIDEISAADETKFDLSNSEAAYARHCVLELFETHDRNRTAVASLIGVSKFVVGEIVGPRSVRPGHKIKAGLERVMGLTPDQFRRDADRFRRTQSGTLVAVPFRCENLEEALSIADLLAPVPDSVKRYLRERARNRRELVAVARWLDLIRAEIGML